MFYKFAEFFIQMLLFFSLFSLPLHLIEFVAIIFWIISTLIISNFRLLVFKFSHVVNAFLRDDWNLPVKRTLLIGVELNLWTAINLTATEMDWCNSTMVGGQEVRWNSCDNSPERRQIPRLQANPETREVGRESQTGDDL